MNQADVSHIPQNPIIAGFHPDPSICCVDDQYILVNSSFEYCPGLPIFTSSDLYSWTQVGHVLDGSTQSLLEGIRPSGGIYAPTIRHHDGRFWLVTTNVSGPPGQLVTSAPDPEGPWHTPILIQGAVGIDPDLAWTDDGDCILSWSGELPVGQQGILQATIDPVQGYLLDPPQVIWRGTGGQFPEGPHLYRRNGWWYLLIAEGGTERGHTITIARSRSHNGPFEACPNNPMLTARSTSWPVQNIGHADFVQRADGSWAMVFLGVRTRGATPSWHILGRETFAANIEWHHDWPIVTDFISPQSSHNPFIEELTGQKPPKSWVAAASPLNNVLEQTDGSWKVRGTIQNPTFVGRRQQHFYINVKAQIGKGGTDGGIELRIDPRHRIRIEIDKDKKVRATLTVGGIDTLLGCMTWNCLDTLELFTKESPEQPGTPYYGPDEVVVGVRKNDTFTELGRCDGRYFSTEVAGGFTGRFVGLFSTGTLDVDSFNYWGTDLLETA